MAYLKERRILLLRLLIIANFDTCNHIPDYKLYKSRYTLNPNNTPPHLESEVRRIQEQPHQTTTKRTRDGNSHDPRQEQETNTLEVDSLEGTVAEADADGGASDTHGG